jgi:hypothetical protein
MAKLTDAPPTTEATAKPISRSADDKYRLAAKQVGQLTAEQK